MGKEDNLSLFNRLWKELQAKWAPKNISKNYDTIIDYKDILKGNVPKIFSETQSDKPSPVAPFYYRDVMNVVKGFPKKYGVTRSAVGHTNSMEPTFDYWDLLFKMSYEKYKKYGGELRVGQICIYEWAGIRIVHRYIGKTSDGRFVFKGDNNRKADPPVTEDKIKDVVVGMIYTFNKVKDGQD